MKNKLLFASLILALSIISCDNSKTKKGSTKPQDTLNIKKDSSKNLVSKVEKANNFGDFVPKGYVIFDKLFGDLNKDGLEDCVIIIKGTDKSKVITDEYRSVLDRNRRGIIVLFNKDGNYEIASKNYSCFSSENEDGGVYYSPELDFEIKKGNLYINYAHGRYGYWSFIFRYQNSDFELIGYDSSNNTGPIVNSSTSINYITKKKIVNVNTNENAETEGETFKETITKINASELLKLSEIKDFDELHLSED